MHGGLAEERGSSAWASLGRPWLAAPDVLVFEVEPMRGEGGSTESVARCRAPAQLR